MIKKTTILFFMLALVPLLGISQPIGNNLYYNGIDEYVDAGHDLKFRPEYITVEMWVNPINITEGEELIRNSDDLNKGWLFSFNSNKIRFIVGYNNNNTPSTSLNLGWQHIVGTWNGKWLKIYKNGELVEKTKLNNNKTPINYGQSNGDDVSGLRMGGGAGWLSEGRIDEVRIWNKVLTEIQINSMMNYEIENDGNDKVQLVGTKTVLDLDFCTDLNAYYKFNGANAPGQIIDSSCNSNDATGENMDHTNIGDKDSGDIATWQGDGTNWAGSDWNTASNWVNGEFPNSNRNVVIIDTQDGNLDPNHVKAGNYNKLFLENTKTINGINLGDGASGHPVVIKELRLSTGTSAYIKTSTSNTPTNLAVTDLENNGTLVIEAKTSLDVIDIDNSGTFIIKSDATGTGSLITNGAVTNTGTFNVERYVAYTNYGTISTPVTSDASVFAGHQLLSHTEANRAGGNQYASVVGTDILNPMEGYFFLLDENNFNAERKLYFTGTPNNGPYTFTLTSTEYTGNGDYFGWNLVGNPYPSSITWTQTENNISNTKVNSTMYLFDGANNTWLTFNPTLPLINSEIDNIPVGQAFFVQLNSTAGSNTSLNATFTNALRAHNTSNVNFGSATPASAKKAANSKTEVEYPDNYFELKASINGNIDKAYYHFRDDATFEFDNKFDSYKLMAWNGGQPNVYFYSGDTKTSIQQEPETEVVKVGFYVSSGEQVEFSLENTNSFSSLVLEDKKENTFTDLLLTSYVFTNDNSFKDRFVLHLKKQTLSENEEVVDVTKIYYSDNELHVVFKDYVKHGDVSIYDIQGRFVLSQKITNSNKEVIIQSDLNNGIYIVKVNSDKGQMSKTIILK